MKEYCALYGCLYECCRCEYHWIDIGLLLCMCSYVWSLEVDRLLLLAVLLMNIGTFTRITYSILRMYVMYRVWDAFLRKDRKEKGVDVVAVVARRREK